MTLHDYTVIGLPSPDLTEAEFVAILQKAHSPAQGAASAVWNYCRRRGVSPAFLLAMFKAESSFGLKGTATQTHSWGNTRSPSFGGVPEMGTVPGRSGVFPVFANWADGGISTAARFLDHAPYHGKTTVAQIIPVWAPKSDLNDPEDYIRAVLASIEGWVGNAPPAGTGGTTVALSKPPVIASPSPNRGGYASPHEPQLICWHITQGTDSLGWLQSPQSGASANYLIARDGKTYELVPPTESAWANGKTCKPDMSNPIIAQCINQGRNVNTVSVSIEHEGMSSLGKGSSLTTAQIAATVRLTAWLCATFGIAPDRGHIIKHAQVDACDRPNCPGFSEVEWVTWVDAINEIVRSGSTTPQAPPSGPGESIRHYVNAQGVPVTEIVWGGKAKAIRGGNIVDLGISVDGDPDGVYHRSVQANAFKEWVKE